MKNGVKQCKFNLDLIQHYGRTPRKTQAPLETLFSIGWLTKGKHGFELIMDQLMKHSTSEFIQYIKSIIQYIGQFFQGQA